MRDLRARCDWDAAQTHQSLRPYLVEESHELDEAIQSGDAAMMREELGDLLFQILFHSVIAEERAAFAFADVAQGLISKMKGRHPHLYGDGTREPWEGMKSKKRHSIGDGLPTGLPPLHRAHRLQDRAAGVGFDWPDLTGPTDKIREELQEVCEQVEKFPPKMAPGGTPVRDEHFCELESELGDLLFACVNLCRKAGVHASLALESANAKFERRFKHMEQLARERGTQLEAEGLEGMDALWEEAKNAAASGQLPAASGQLPATG